MAVDSGVMAHWSVAENGKLWVIEEGKDRIQGIGCSQNLWEGWGAVLGGPLGQALRKTPRVILWEPPLPGPGGDWAHTASALLGAQGLPLLWILGTGMLLQRTK